MFTRCSLRYFNVRPHRTRDKLLYHFKPVDGSIPRRLAKGRLRLGPVPLPEQPFPPFPSSPGSISGCELLHLSKGPNPMLIRCVTCFCQLASMVQASPDFFALIYSEPSPYEVGQKKTSTLEVPFPSRVAKSGLRFTFTYSAFSMFLTNIT